MRVLVLKPFLVAKTNGGEISLIERLRLLESWGAKIFVRIAYPSSEKTTAINSLKDLGTPLNEDHYFVDGIRCEIKFDEKFHPFNIDLQTSTEDFFRSKIAELHPDIVIAHYTDFFALTAAVKWNSSRSFILVTDDEYPRPEKLNQFPTIGPFYKNIQNLLVASRFMKQSLKRELPWAKTFRVPNLVGTLDLYSKAAESTAKDYWLFVNPIPVKGLDFVLELANDLRSEKFLFVGNWQSEHPPFLPPNIHFIPRKKNLLEAFARAKALLMPSVWQEAFGRLPLEAMSARVPVFTSDRGALPETVGDGGLVLPLEKKLWREAMQQLEGRRVSMIEAGVMRVQTYQSEVENRFRALKRMLHLS